MGEYDPYKANSVEPGIEEEPEDNDGQEIKPVYFVFGAIIVTVLTLIASQLSGVNIF